MLRRLPAVGRAQLVRISSGPMVVQPTADLKVGGLSPGRPAAGSILLRLCRK